MQLDEAPGLVTYVVHLHLHKAARARAQGQQGARVVRMNVDTNEALVADNQHGVTHGQHALAQIVDRQSLALDQHFGAVPVR